MSSSTSRAVTKRLTPNPRRKHEPQGLTHREIGAIVGCSEDMVVKRIRQALVGEALKWADEMSPALRERLKNLAG